MLVGADRGWIRRAMTGRSCNAAAHRRHDDLGATTKMQRSQKTKWRLLGICSFLFVPISSATPRDACVCARARGATRGTR